MQLHHLHTRQSTKAKCEVGLPSNARPENVTVDRAYVHKAGPVFNFFAYLKAMQRVVQLFV